MSDQWGQSQEPQNPYGQQPAQNPYGQQPPPSPYGQQPGQNPYGQPATPYGQGPTNPYGQAPNPYGQTQGQIPGQIPGQYPGQIPGQYPGQPGQPGYGYPAPLPPQKSKKGLFIGGAVAVVVIVIAVVAVSAGGSGSGGTATKAQTCAGFQTEETTSNNENPTTVAETIQDGRQDQVQVQVQTLANNAQSGTLKVELQKYNTDINNVLSYLQANPNIDMSGSSEPPAQLVADGSAMEADTAAIYATCGLTDPDSGTSD